MWIDEVSCGVFTSGEITQGFLRRREWEALALKMK